MSNSLTKKPQRAQTSLVLSAPVRGALRRIKKIHGINYKSAVERGVVMLENFLATQTANGRTI